LENFEVDDFDFVFPFVVPAIMLILNTILDCENKEKKLMHIEKLSLINFKNYQEASLNFSDKINCLIGLNGSGKTNILDAIYYLSMTKSAHNSIDSQNIKFDESFFSIKGTFYNSSKKSDIVCFFQEGIKKSFKVNKVDYDKLSQHIGKFPVVLITPYDTDIIREGSETRRKFFDTIISQIDKEYLNHLIRYNNNLKQRNGALKQFNKARKINHDLLDTYDQVLVSTANKIFKKRTDFIQTFETEFLDKYSFITDSNEEVSIDYTSNVSSLDFEMQLKNSRNRDVSMERTSLGTHKDDFKFTINSQALKKFGSQGQQKSFAIALKLAQFGTIENETMIKPILLLDDIFDKLDTNRIAKLLKLIHDNEFGQVFLTDAREERTRTTLKEFNIQSSYFIVEKGVAVKVNEEE
jgi:DNA replication and repair protein RecF